MFFAKKVVFVEGDTEKVILPYLAKRLGIFDPDISIVDCGSKHNLPLYIIIANAFKIPYLVIHDEDSHEDPMNGQINSLVDASLGSIEVLSPNFEEVSGVPKDRRKGKVLAALDHLENMDISEIPNRLRQVVRAVYDAPAEEQNV